MRSLFDRTTGTPPDPGEEAAGPRERRRILTVSELNSLTRDLLEESLASVWVEGEISNLRRYPSGHTYFTLKDGGAQIAAVLFRGAAQTLPFSPEDGLKVLAHGRISLYEPRGTYQLIVAALEPAGLGALQLAFEQLKARLLAEGLFDASRKRPLPLLPVRIGVVASASGAAWRDILKVLERRFANLHVILAPSRVQGEGAAQEIAAAIGSLNRLGGIDVLIVARGGGSIEDLWPFNDERVARAIARSAIPVVSAVGHETDTTLADLVADLRAPTPSAAAEMVVRSKEELTARVAALRARLLPAGRLRLERCRRDLEAAGGTRGRDAVRDLLRDLSLRLDDHTERLRAALDRRARDEGHRLALLRERMSPPRLAERLRARGASALAWRKRLETAAAGGAERARGRAAALSARLHALSPLAVLARGYAICRLEDTGTILKESAAARTGDAVSVLLHRGSLVCAVTEVRRDGEREEGV